MENRSRKRKYESADEEEKNQKNSEDALNLLFFLQTSTPNINIGTQSNLASRSDMPNMKTEIGIEEFFDKYYKIEDSIKKKILGKCNPQDLIQLTKMMNKLHEMGLLSEEVITFCFAASNKSCADRGFAEEDKIDLWSIWSSIAEETIIKMIKHGRSYQEIFEFFSSMRHEYAMLFDKNSYEKSFYGQLRFRMHNDIYSLQRPKSSLTDENATKRIIALVEDQFNNQLFHEMLKANGVISVNNDSKKIDTSLFDVDERSVSYFSKEGIELRLCYRDKKNELCEVVYCLPATTELIDLTMEFNNYEMKEFKEIILDEKLRTSLFVENSYDLGEKLFIKLSKLADSHDEQELLEELANFIFHFCRECPIERGTAAIGQWLIRSIVKLLYPQSEPILDFKIKCIPYDIYAQCCVLNHIYINAFMSEVNKYIKINSKEEVKALRPDRKV